MNININGFNLNEMSRDNIATWPAPVRYTILAILLIVVLFLGYQFDLKNKIADLDSEKNNERKIMQILEIKIAEAANLAAYRKQLQEITLTFQQLLQQLPTRSEVPGLLEDITKTGKSNRLEFILFKPLPEIQQAFYSELPMKISVVGDYHDLAGFISAVAQFDRIVTLHDFTLQPMEASKDANPLNVSQEFMGKLVLNITAKTYRYTGSAIHKNKKRENKRK